MQQFTKRRRRKLRRKQNGPGQLQRSKIQFQKTLQSKKPKRKTSVQSKTLEHNSFASFPRESIAWGVAKQKKRSLLTEFKFRDKSSRMEFIKARAKLRRASVKSKAAKSLDRNAKLTESFLKKQIKLSSRERNRLSRQASGNEHSLGDPKTSFYQFYFKRAEKALLARKANASKSYSLTKKVGLALAE